MHSMILLNNIIKMAGEEQKFTYNVFKHRVEKSKSD